MLEHSPWRENGRAGGLTNPGLCVGPPHLWSSGAQGWRVGERGQTQGCRISTVQGSSGMSRGSPSRAQCQCCSRDQTRPWTRPVIPCDAHPHVKLSGWRGLLHDSLHYICRVQNLPFWPRVWTNNMWKEKLEGPNTGSLGRSTPVSGVAMWSSSCRLHHSCYTFTNVEFPKWHFQERKGKLLECLPSQWKWKVFSCFLLCVVIIEASLSKLQPDPFL